MAKLGADIEWVKKLQNLIRQHEKEVAAVVEAQEKKRNEELGIVKSIEDIIRARLKIARNLVRPDKKLKIQSVPSIEESPHVPPSISSGITENAGFIANTALQKPDKYPHEYEIELVMPELSEVTGSSLLFRTIIRSQKRRNQELPTLSVFVRAFHKYSDAELDQKGFLELPYKKVDKNLVDDFVKERIIVFIKSWYARKVAYEKDREREYQIRIVLK